MLRESFENMFDSSLIDYRGDFEKNDDNELKSWLSLFIDDLSSNDYDIEYINDERCINVYKDINIMLLPGETKIPYKFNYIKGDFNCSFCGLTTLENCPNKIEGTFNCSFNNLKNLDFIPDAKYYNLTYNQLGLNSLNKIIDKKLNNERHPRHSKVPSSYDPKRVYVDSSKTGIFSIAGNPRLLKYQNSIMYKD